MPQDTSKKVPLFPVKMVLFPGSQAVLRIFEPRYLDMLADAQRAKTPFGVVMCRNHEDEVGTMAKVGCFAKVRDISRFEDDTWVVRVTGGQRFELLDIDSTSRPYLIGNTRPLGEQQDMALDDPVFQTIRELLDIYRDLLADIDPEMVPEEAADDSDTDLTFTALDQMILPDDNRQMILEMPSLKSRCNASLSLLRKEIETLRFLLADEGEGAIAPWRLN